MGLPAHREWGTRLADALVTAGRTIPPEHDSTCQFGVADASGFGLCDTNLKSVFQLLHVLCLNVRIGPHRGSGHLAEPRTRHCACFGATEHLDKHRQVKVKHCVLLQHFPTRTTWSLDRNAVHQSASQRMGQVEHVGAHVEVQFAVTVVS